MKASAFINRIELNDQLVSALEYQTRGQSENDLWLQHRFGCVTASVFGKIIKRVASMSSLAEQFLCKPSPPASLPALKYGHEHENDAWIKYMQRHLECGQQVTVKQSGLLLQNNGFIACSPDGLAYDHHTKEQGLLEIKCPISAETRLSELTLKSNFLH